VITVRVYRHGSETVVAAADKSLLGRCLREDEIRLDVCSSFYEGEDADEELLVSRLQMATIANLVGEETVGAATRNNLISEECVMKIEGVPHVQMVKM
jgi:hypothetical protein